MTTKEIDWSKYEEKLTGIVPKEIFTKVDFPRLPAEVIQEFREMEDPTPTLSDILDGLGINGTVSASTLIPVNPGKVVAGQVVTIRYGLEQPVPLNSHEQKRKAGLGDRDGYAVAQSGDIVVMDNSGRADVSTIGGISTTVANLYGLSGCIVDGGVRDIGLMRELGFPVWARGRTPISGKFRVRTVEINGVVQCVGVKVSCGDLAVADDSGVVFVPYEMVGKVLDMAQRAFAHEEKLLEAIKDGVPMSKLKDILSPDKW